MSEYEKRAEEFLRRNKLRMTITKVPYTPPVWEEEENKGCRNKYRVGIHRPLKSGYDGTPRRIGFNFWGSINDAEKGIHPSSYNVLACISGDVYCPDTFEEFCSEYGYDEDSRKAWKIFKKAGRFAEKLRLFFSEQELEKLQEIQ